MIKETIEKLLQGEFICAVTAPASVVDLETPETRATIDETLGNLNRKVAQTRNGSVYYCAWIDIDKNERNGIRREYEIIREELRPIIEFILLVMDANMRDTPLLSGEKISEAEIISKIESNVFLSERVINLMQIHNLRKSSEPIPQQVKTMLDIMQKMGIIMEQNLGSRIFITTGKIEYIYEVLEFINQHENIYDAQNVDSGLQGDLF